jgi:riboflavin kinase/FMN adenylyltransferase
MRVVHGVDALDASLGRLFVVIGVFDGLHRGHLYLLEQLRRAATARNAEPAVVTFDHHPDEVILGTAPPLLCDPDERLERLEAAGVAVTVVQTFDVALRMTPFDAFVRRIADRVDLAGFLMTPESAFGHDRGGTPETVAALGRELGYETVIVPPFRLDGEPVSSGAIRGAIAAGEMATAERLLGRPVSLHGDLAPDGITGRSELRLSMPMALPPTGVYAVTADPGGPATLDIDGGGRLWLDVGAPRTGQVRVRFEPTERP